MSLEKRKLTQDDLRKAISEYEKKYSKIKKRTAQSMQIIADDQEEATERWMDEIENQMRHLSRIVDLLQYMEHTKQENIDDDISSEDEEEFDEFIDWRAKSSYKKI